MSLNALGKQRDKEQHMHQTQSLRVLFKGSFKLVRRAGVGRGYLKSVFKM
ncbi:hypothetical protein IFVP22_C220482 [Vibrio parahaemolyticus]